MLVAILVILWGITSIWKGGTTSLSISQIKKAGLCSQGLGFKDKRTGVDSYLKAQSWSLANSNVDSSNPFEAISSWVEGDVHVQVQL